MKTTKQEAAKIIDDKLKQAWQLVEDCVKLAEHSGCCFELPWGGEGTDQRGMGATYVPESASEQDKKWMCNDGWGGNYYTGWQPSAGTC
jgi:hypothetical protein